MAAPDVELAEAIVKDMNDSARDWPLLLEAKRSWVPLWVGKDQLKGLQCLINPWPVVEVTTESRGSCIYQYSIDFGFAKRLENRNTCEIDELRETVEAAANRYTVTDFIVTDIGRFVALRRLDEYVTFDPTRLTRQVDGNATNYVGDFLSIFRVPYRFIKAV